MTAFWTEPDYDDHELVQLVRDRKSGLTAIISLHSTHLGPAAGGTRFWHYAEAKDAMRDALRLSRGMGKRVRFLRVTRARAVFASQSPMLVQQARAPATRGLTARCRGVSAPPCTAGPSGPGYVAIVAQLVRAPVCGTGGRGFETPRSPHFPQSSP